MSKKVKSSYRLIQVPDEDESKVCWDEYNNWMHWCRLCAKEDRSNIDVFRKKEDCGTEFTSETLATAIGKYFCVDIKTDDELPKHVCGECETLINELCTFTERVNKVQTMFELLLNIKNDKLIDPNELRLQYGLLDEERQHIIRSPERQLSEYEMDQEVEVLVQDEEEMLEDEQELEYKEDEKEEMEEQYEQEEGEDEQEEEEEDDDEEEQEIEEAEQQHEKELDLKPDLFVDSMLDDEQEEEREDSEDEPEPELDAEIMEQLEQDLEINTEEYEITEAENADTTSNYSQELLETEDEDETLLNQVQQEIRELKKFCKSEKSSNLKFKKKVVESVEILPSKQERKKEQNHNRTKEQLKSDVQMSQKIITDPSDDKKLEIILPPKRKRGRPSRTSDDYKKSKKLIKNEPTDGNVSDEQTHMEFKFECSLCPKKYKSFVIYKKHMNDVHNIIDETVVEYTCEECSKTFSSERNLTMHMRTHLPMELKQVHPCPYCEKRFTKEAIMVQHISGAHLNQKPFICEECGRALKTHAALREHKLTHTDDCPFECEVCHKRFKNKARLKIHSDIHAETIYKCAICGIILNTRRTLNMHMLVHSDVKAFKCDYCGNAFKRAKALKNHLLIHTGLKPYICNFCFKPFSNGSNCRSHKKKAHPEELAALEASGEKVRQTNVPKLDHLRAVSKRAENLQPVSKQSTLPPNWREILLKAEERATRLDEKYKQEPAENEDSKTQLQLENAPDIEVEAELAAMEC